MYERTLKLPNKLSEHFFLWGPRQVGKSTLLKTVYKDAIYIDLLRSEQFRKYKARPEILREELNLESDAKRVVIDEIQKVPELLDEVHGLIEEKKHGFTLCGSSARKLKNQHVNLLGGRALRFELFGFAFHELKNNFNLTQWINRGNILMHYESDQSKLMLDAYVSDYLKEEIALEALVRNLSSFTNFLYAASFSDTEIINFTNIASDCGVSSVTVKSYFEILQDTLLGRYLPAYTKKPKRRVIHAPKFYFSNVGVVNYLAKRNNIEMGSSYFGKAFENFIFHEICAYNSYKKRFAQINYWRLSNGVEVDFVINDLEVCIEVKANRNIKKEDLNHLREISIEHVVKRKIIVCLENVGRKTNDGVEILPYQDFLDQLWCEKIF